MRIKSYFFFSLVLIAACHIIFPFRQAAIAQGNSEYTFGVTGDTLLPPAKRDAYGPGMDSDATGRPFYWAPKSDAGNAQPSHPDGTLRVKPDAYGLGVGMDQYGRPMERRSLNE